MSKKREKVVKKRRRSNLREERKRQSKGKGECRKEGGDIFFLVFCTWIVSFFFSPNLEQAK